MHRWDDLRTPPEPAPSEDGPADATWAYVWPGGRRLAAELAELADLRGRVVIDLGCGRGALGLQALRLAALEVWFADGNRAAVGWIDELIRLNALGDRASACHLPWGAAPPLRCDVLLGGDVLYRRECFPALLATIAAALAPDGIALLSDPRERLEAELPDLAAVAGLSYASARRPTGYTLVRLRRR